MVRRANRSAHGIRPRAYALQRTPVLAWVFCSGVHVGDGLGVAARLVRDARSSGNSLWRRRSHVIPGSEASCDSLQHSPSATHAVQQDNRVAHNARPVERPQTSRSGTVFGSTRRRRAQRVRLRSDGSRDTCFPASSRISTSDTRVSACAETAHEPGWLPAVWLLTTERRRKRAAKASRLPQSNERARLGPRDPGQGRHARSSSNTPAPTRVAVASAI